MSRSKLVNISFRSPRNKVWLCTVSIPADAFDEVLFMKSNWLVRSTWISPAECCCEEERDVNENEKARRDGPKRSTA